MPLNTCRRYGTSPILGGFSPVQTRCLRQPGVDRGDIDEYGKQHIYLAGLQVDTKANRARSPSTSTTAPPSRRRAATGCCRRAAASRAADTGRREVRPEAQSRPESIVSRGECREGKSKRNKALKHRHDADARGARRSQEQKKQGVRWSAVSAFSAPSSSSTPPCETTVLQSINDGA